MPATYAKDGTLFEYPESWRIDTEEAGDDADTVTVYSPGGAFWSVRFEEEQREPEELVQTALDAMREEYRDLDAEPVRELVGNAELTGVDVNFYCLDLLNTALIRAVRTGRGTCFILCQAEDREFDQLEPVFQAITTSLLRHF